MTLKPFPIGIVIMLFCISKTQQCPPKNISCNDVKVAKGFKFLYPCPERGEISVIDNKTLIANAVLGIQWFSYLSEVISMDNYSLVTRDCRDLRVECIFHNEKNFVEDICVDYKMTEKMKNPDPDDSPTPQNLSSDKFILISVIVLVMGMVGWLVAYIYCKKKQNGAPAVSGIFKYLKTCPCLREGISKAEMGETEETRHLGGREVQQVTVGDLDPAQANIVNRLIEISATYPRGSGEKDIKQDDKLGSVQSIDPKADGKTPQSFRLDRNLSNEGLQPNKTIREMHNGWISNDRGPEDHGNEEQMPLMNERAAIQHFDMTGEAVALVNRHGFGPD